MVVYLIGSTAIVVFICPLLVIACVILIGGTIAYFVLSLDKGTSHGSTYVSSSSDSGSSSATEFTGCKQCSNCKHYQNGNKYALANCIICDDCKDKHYIFNMQIF